MKFEFLSIDENNTVLDWMRTGLDAGVKKFIEQKAYHAFLLSLKNDTKFDPVKVFEDLEANTKEHFAHTVLALRAIKEARTDPPMKHIKRQKGKAK